MPPAALGSVLRSFRHFLRHENSDLKTAYLFGSYAKNRITIDSDIDVAVIYKKLSDVFDMQVHLMKLRRNFDTRIEPHVFRESDFDLSNPLALEIINTGVEII